MTVIIIGFIAGILSGMGVGGGMILIPALCLFQGTPQKVAQCVNLFYFIPTAVSALFIHIKNKNVEFKKALPIILSGLLFSFLGAFIAVKFSPEILRKIFAGFILIAGIYEIKKAA